MSGNRVANLLPTDCGGLKLAVLPLLLLGMGLTKWASADGFQFPGVGAKALGRGGAVVADCTDWTAIYWNPAGLADYDGSRGEVGIEIIRSHFESRDGDSIAVGPGFQGPPLFFPTQFTTTKLTGVAHLPALGAAMRLSKKAVLGLGVYAPLLNGVDFLDSMSQGPFTLEGVFDSELYNLVFNASLGYRLNDRLAVGGGVNFVYSDLSLLSAQRLSGPVAGEQSIELAGNGSGVEIQGGVTYRLLSTLRFGAVVRSGASSSIEGSSRVVVSGLLDSSGGFEFEFKQPPIFTIGVAWDVRPALTVSFDWQRTLWEDFQNGIDFADPAVPDVMNTAFWLDSNRFRGGLLYRFNDRQSLSGGYYFASRADSMPDFTSVTDADLHQFSVNYSHDFSRIGVDVGVLTGGGTARIDGNETYTGGTQINAGVRYKW